MLYQLAKTQSSSTCLFNQETRQSFHKKHLHFELFCLFYKALSKSSGVQSKGSNLIMIFNFTFIQCISWRHIQSWLETFFKFLPYVWNIRRLSLLLRSLKFPNSQPVYQDVPKLEITSTLHKAFQDYVLIPICLTVFAKDFKCFALSRLPSVAVPVPAPSILLNIETMRKLC